MIETAENVHNKRSPLDLKMHAQSIMSIHEISRLYANVSKDAIYNNSLQIAIRLTIVTVIFHYYFITCICVH